MVYLRQGREADQLGICLHARKRGGSGAMSAAQGPGKSIGPYQLGQFLGAGPVGDVFRAQKQNQPQTELAIKMIRPPYSQISSVRNRFLMLANTVGRLDHPHILPLEFIGEQGGQLIAVMPYVVQGSLMSRLARSRLTPKDAGPLFKQICDAIAYGHSHGVVHGNIKPTNVLLFESRHALVSDFTSLWLIPEVDLTTSGTTAEAIAYMAPEQASGISDVRTDVYSLGAMLFHALTGSPPFAGRNPIEVMSRHLRQPPPSLLDPQYVLPPNAYAYDEVIRMALSKDPSGRFQSAQAMARALAEAGAMANELPSRIMPNMRPNGVPLLPPAQPNPNYPQIIPNQRPPTGYPQQQQQQQQLPPGMYPTPAFPPSAPMGRPPQGAPPMMPRQMPPQQPINQPQGMYPPPAFPPSAPVDDPLVWLMPDQANSRPATKQEREFADFMTARYHTELPPDPTTETGAVPSQRQEWNDDELGSREYTAGPFTSEQQRERGRDQRDDTSYGYTDYTDYTGAVEQQPSENRRKRRSHGLYDDLDQSQNIPVQPQSSSRVSRPVRYGAPKEEADEMDSRRYPAEPQRRNRYQSDYSQEMSAAYPAQGRSRSRYTIEGGAVRPMDRRSSKGRQEANMPAEEATQSQKKKSRLPGILTIIAAVVLILNGLAIATFAPNICPNHVCDGLHNRLIKIIPVKKSDGPIHLRVVMLPVLTLQR